MSAKIGSPRNMGKGRIICRVVSMNIPYLFFAFLATKLGQAARLAPGVGFSEKALYYIQGLSLAFRSVLPSFYPTDLLVGIIVAALIRLAVYVRGKNAKKFRKNEEYGSARWDAYYLLKELLYGRRRRRHYDAIRQDHRAVLPPFSG